MIAVHQSLAINLYRSYGTCEFGPDDPGALALHGNSSRPLPCEDDRNNELIR
jgi:hypothetical protein